MFACHRHPTGIPIHIEMAQLLCKDALFRLKWSIALGWISDTNDGSGWGAGLVMCVVWGGCSMILGDPWFRKWVVYHDLRDLTRKQIGLALRAPQYKLAVSPSLPVVHSPCRLDADDEVENTSGITH